MATRPESIAVIGSGSCDEETGRIAYQVGEGIARHGAVLVCGGRGGVMERAAAGARAGGGMTVGILPGRSPEDSPPNPSIELPIFTGLGQARNLAVVLSAGAVIAIGGGWGTLSEIALAAKHGKPVVLLGSWELGHPQGVREKLVRTAATAEEAVALAAQALKGSTR